MRTAMEAVATPLLERLRNDTGETAQLWVRRGQERVCVLSFDSRHELRASLPRGARLMMPAGSSGRLLSGEPEALEDVANHGWLESVGMRTPGLGSVSSPVILRGNIIAAVCLAMPLARVKVSPGADFGPTVASVARRITEELEQRPI